MILRTLATVAKHIEIISYHLLRHFVIYMYDLNLLELLVTGNPAGNKCFICFVDVWCAKMSNMTKITYCSWFDHLKNDFSTFTFHDLLLIYYNIRIFHLENHSLKWFFHEFDRHDNAVKILYSIPLIKW